MSVTLNSFQENVLQLFETIFTFINSFNIDLQLFVSTCKIWSFSFPPTGSNKDVWALLQNVSDFPLHHDTKYSGSCPAEELTRVQLLAENELQHRRGGSRLSVTCYANVVSSVVPRGVPASASGFSQRIQDLLPFTHQATTIGPRKNVEIKHLVFSTFRFLTIFISLALSTQPGVSSPTPYVHQHQTSFPIFLHKCDQLWKGSSSRGSYVTVENVSIKYTKTLLSDLYYKTWSLSICWNSNVVVTCEFWPSISSFRTFLMIHPGGFFSSFFCFCTFKPPWHHVTVTEGAGSHTCVKSLSFWDPMCPPGSPSASSSAVSVWTGSLPVPAPRCHHTEVCWWFLPYCSTMGQQTTEDLSSTFLWVSSENSPSVCPKHCCHGTPGGRDRSDSLSVSLVWKHRPHIITLPVPAVSFDMTNHVWRWWRHTQCHISKMLRVLM